MSPGKRVRPRPSTTSAFVTFNSDPPILLILPSSNSTLRCSNTCSPSKTRTSRMSCKVAGAWQRAAIADNHSQNIKTVDLRRISSRPGSCWTNYLNLRLVIILFHGGDDDQETNLQPCSQRRRFVQRSEEHTSELQSRGHLVCRLL